MNEVLLKFHFNFSIAAALLVLKFMLHTSREVRFHWFLY